MFTMSIKSVIQMLVNHELKRGKAANTDWHDDGSISTDGIIIPVNVQANDYTDEDTKSIGDSIFMLFHSNTSVYYVSRYDEKGKYVRRIDEINVDEWENTSNHDSCWRSDGFQFLSDLYFKVCKAVDPDKAPIDVDTSAGLGFSWPVTKVRVRFRHIDNRNKIVSIEELSVDKID
jgi:hypothetical protein